MKIQSFYTVPAICLYYEDNSERFYQVADDQDLALLDLAKRAELENDCELPAGIVVVWAGETVAFRVAGSTNETEVSGCFMGTGLIVLARYLDETGQQCVMELTGSEDAEHIEQLVAALNALAEPAPAQDEQQPVAWRWMYNGEPDGPYAFNCPLPDDDVVWRGQMADRPRTVQPLYAAPIAQTAPQPAEQQPAPDVKTLVEALRSILGWRELRSGNDFPVERIEEIARDALATSQPAEQHPAPDVGVLVEALELARIDLKIWLESFPDAYREPTEKIIERIDSALATPQPAEQQPAPDADVLVDALERVMYCDEIKFLPEGVQQAVSDALAAHRKQGGDI